MGGNRTTRAIKNGTTPPNRTVQVQPRLRPMSRASTKRGPRTTRYGPTLQTIRTNVRAPPVERARTTRGLRVAREGAGLARAETTGRVGVGRETAEGVAGGAHAIISKAARIARTATPRMMAEISMSN